MIRIPGSFDFHSPSPSPPSHHVSSPAMQPAASSCSTTICSPSSAPTRRKTPDTVCTEKARQRAFHLSSQYSPHPIILMYIITKLLCWSTRTMWWTYGNSTAGKFTSISNVFFFDLIFIAIQLLFRIVSVRPSVGHEWISGRNIGDSPSDRWLSMDQEKK